MSRTAVIERCDAPIEGALTGLDRLRRFSLRLLGRQLAPWMANREYRIALWGAFFIVCYLLTLVMSKVSYGHDTSPVSTMKFVDSFDSNTVAVGPIAPLPLSEFICVMYAAGKAVSQVVRTSR